MDRQAEMGEGLGQSKANKMIVFCEGLGAVLRRDRHDHTIRHFIVVQDRTSAGGTSDDLDAVPLTGSDIHFLGHILRIAQRKRWRLPAVDPQGRRGYTRFTSLQDRFIQGHIHTGTMVSCVEKAPLHDWTFF